MRFDEESWKGRRCMFCNSENIVLKQVDYWPEIHCEDCKKVEDFWQ